MCLSWSQFSYHSFNPEVKLVIFKEISIGSYPEEAIGQEINTECLDFSSFQPLQLDEVWMESEELHQYATIYFWSFLLDIWL